MSMGSVEPMWVARIMSWYPKLMEALELATQLYP